MIIDEDYNILEESFRAIRDERGVHANTAKRIGTAFLDLLRMTRNGVFDEIIFERVLNKPKFLEGLISLGTIILGEYASGLEGGIITPEGAAELKDLWVREHARLGDGSKYRDEAGRVIPALEVQGDSTFTSSLSSPDFVSAFFGGLGWAIQKKEVVNAAGVVEYKYHLEIDDATIRGTLRVFEQIVSQLMGENANRYFSDMMEVDHYDSKSGRVYLKTKGGKLYNPFRTGDIIRVQQYNDDPSESNDWYVTKAYELRITSAGLGNKNDEERLDWVEFENFTTTMEHGTAESLILENDTFVRWDNDIDPKRKGLVSIMAIGENTPYMDILYGQKTDPQHALKGRIGNLDGIHTQLFGWLEGFGAYINNLYGVGKFFNFQTGESLTASMQMTRELFKRVYTETIYNISEDDNFIENGFFQHGLEGWNKCAIDGSAAPGDTNTEMLGINEGNGAEPILINGAPLSINSKLTAKVEDMDGCRVLHLYGMGVSQDFVLIKANGTHELMESANPNSYSTRRIPNKLYMAVRILPVTAGHLSVRFLKPDRTYTGWERDIDNAIDWKLYQASDNSDLPWDYAGSGKLIISYTGECYIRFVALTTDAVANTWEQYSTKFEQNARHITISASKQASDLTEAVASINIKFDNITTTVTNNKTAADRALANLTSDLNTEVTARKSLEQTYHATWVYQNDRILSLMAGEFNSDGKIKGYADLKVQVNGINTTVTNNKTAADRALANLTSDLNTEVTARKSLEQTYHATWVYQNDRILSLMAGEFNSDGKIKGYADLKVQVNGINTTVTNNKTAADNAINSINDSLGSLWDYAGAIDREQGNSATWINQNKNKWEAVAASFDGSGNVTAAGKVGLYVSNKLSTFTVAADKINFKTGNFTIKNKAGQTTLALDSDGNLTILGTINGGNITGNIGIGSGTNKLFIEPTELGARLVGKTGNTEVLNLGFWTVNGETRCGLRYSNSAYYGKDYFNISGSGGNITGYCDDGVRISHQDNYGTVSFGLSSAHKVYIGSSYISQWPSSASSVNVGQVYLDGDVLKVRMS